MIPTQTSIMSIFCNMRRVRTPIFSRDLRADLVVILLRDLIGPFVEIPKAGSTSLKIYSPNAVIGPMMYPRTCISRYAPFIALVAPSASFLRPALSIHYAD